MSNIPLSSLPIAISLAGNEEVPIVQSGTTKRTTTGAIASLAVTSPGGTGAFVTAVDQHVIFPNSRLLAGSSPIVVTDGGPASSITVSLPSLNAITVNGPLTMGFAGGGVGQLIELNTGGTSPSHGPFVIGVSDVGNPYLDIGYNINPLNWTLINPADLGLFFGQEGDYDDGSGDHKMEQYWQMQRQSGQSPIGGVSTYVRSVFAQYDKVTGLPSALNLSGGGTTGIQFLYNDGTGSATTEQVIGKIRANLTNNNFYIVSQPGGTFQSFRVDDSIANAATGLYVQSNVAGSGVALAALSSATNEDLMIDAKSGGAIRLAGTSNGTVIVGHAVGAGGSATNHGNLVLFSGQTDAAINGLEWKASIGGSGFGYRMPTVFDGSSNMDLKIQSRQNSASWTDALLVKGSTSAVVATNGLFSSSPTKGVGYTTGAGGTITQTVSRTSGVTLNTACGAITLVSAAGSTSFQTFTLTNSAIVATDSVRVTQQSGTDKYQIWVTRTAAGACDITFATIAGTTTEQPVFNFAVVKGVTS